MNDEVTQAEVDAELNEMNAIGKHSIPHKRINRRVNRRRNIRLIAMAVVLVSLLLCIYVWLRSAVGGAISDGNGGAYRINVGGFESSGLQLAFDPDFNEGYLTLTGLGYGNVDSLQGGSLLDKLAMNTTMFDKFKNLAEKESMGSIYDGSFGSANFDQYYANKFYIRNVSDKPLIYRINLEVTGNTNNALDAARFMLVSGDSVSGFNYEVFATPVVEYDVYNKRVLDENGNTVYKDEAEIAAWTYKTTATMNEKLFFANPNTAKVLQTKIEEEAWRCTNLELDSETMFWHYYSLKIDKDGYIYNRNNEQLTSESMLTKENGVYELQPGQSECYTFCVWYEGSDPDHNNSIKNGGMEFTINFEAVNKSALIFTPKDENASN